MFAHPTSGNELTDNSKKLVSARVKRLTDRVIVMKMAQKCPI